MRISGARWTPQINILQITCYCGEVFEHRTDRWKVLCPRGHHGDLAVIREKYVTTTTRPAKQELFLRDPKLTGRIEFTYDENGRKITTSEPFQFDETRIPRNIMDEIKQLIGDGNARVAVSADFGIKDFGTGASAMATVSLSCNQDTATIERAARIAGDLARDIAQEQRQRAENELQAILAARQNVLGGTPGY